MKADKFFNNLITLFNITSFNIYIKINNQKGEIKKNNFNYFYKQHIDYLNKIHKSLFLKEYIQYNNIFYYSHDCLNDELDKQERNFLKSVIVANDKPKRINKI